MSIIFTTFGSGLSIEAENSKSLSHDLLLMMNTSVEERNKMGNFGLDYFNKHFKEEKLLRELEDILKA